VPCRFHLEGWTAWRITGWRIEGRQEPHGRSSPEEETAIAKAAAHARWNRPASTAPLRPGAYFPPSPSHESDVDGGAGHRDWALGASGPATPRAPLVRPGIWQLLLVGLDLPSRRRAQRMHHPAEVDEQPDPHPQVAHGGCPPRSTYTGAHGRGHRANFHREKFAPCWGVPRAGVGGGSVTRHLLPWRWGRIRASTVLPGEVLELRWGSQGVEARILPMIWTRLAKEDWGR
jgi:hypothetical protein